MCGHGQGINAVTFDSNIEVLHGYLEHLTFAVNCLFVQKFRVKKFRFLKTWEGEGRKQKNKDIDR